jgi:hypothetical protein
MPIVYTGEWSGMAHSEISEGVNQWWPVVVDLQGGRRSEVVAFVSYPTLGCKSRLLLRVIETDYLGMDEEFIGPEPCILPDGIIVLQMSDDGSLLWWSDGESRQSDGTLWPARLLPAEYAEYVSDLYAVGDRITVPDANFGQPHPVEVTLTGGMAGEIVGFIRYLDQGCRGTLLLATVAPDFIYLYEDLPATSSTDPCSGDGFFKFGTQGGSIEVSGYQKAEPLVWRRG